MTTSEPPEVEQERDSDMTGANRYDADVAKAKARKEMWRTIQSVVDNLGRYGGLLGLLLGGYATCSKADRAETEKKLSAQTIEIREQKQDIVEAKEATGLVLDYTKAVATSASAAVAAVASAVPPMVPPVKTSPPPAGSSGCWVEKPGGVVRCKADPSTSPRPVSVPAMAPPAPPDLGLE